MHPFTECTDVSEFSDAGGGQRFDGRKRGVAEGTSDRYDFLPENTGFSGAVNVGIKAADTPYVLLLNNDVRVDEYFVAEMVRAIGQSERIFSVSSRMIQMYHPDRLDDAGDMYSLLGWAYQRGVGRDLTHYRRSSRVFSACAGAAIYRREVLRR